MSHSMRCRANVHRSQLVVGRFAATMRHSTRWQANAQGQALVVVAILLGCVLVPLGLAILAINGQRADHAAITALVRRAALDGAGVLTDQSLGAQAPTLVGSSASCRTNTDAATAAGRVCQALRTGLGQLFRGDRPRVNAADALAHTWVTVLNGTPTMPVQDPATREIFHYPSVCVSSAMRVGVLEDDGLGFTYHFHACAQTVFRT